MDYRSHNVIDSPFLAIPFRWRVAMISYFLVYEWFFPVIAAMESGDAETLFVPRVLLRCVHILLICWPLFSYRREFGFLHPLILPTLFATLKGLAKSPLALVMPFELPLFSFDIFSPSFAHSIKRLSPGDLAWMRLWHEAVQIIALVCYYGGYYSLNVFKLPNLRFNSPRRLVPVCFAATAVCSLIGIFFIQYYGDGLAKHLIAMRSGRSALFEGLGQFLSIANFAVVPVLVWFSYARRPFLDPRWLLALTAASLIAILVSGSRSAFVYPLIVLMFLWWRKAGRVLIGPSLALAVLAAIAVGTFGAIRQDYASDEIDTSILRLDSFDVLIDSAQTEFRERNNLEGSFAAFAGANSTLLWGRTYVASAAFFVPRAVWPGKPRSADAYNMWINLYGNDLASFGSDRLWGIPVGPVEEAFWNFHLPGVVVVFLLLGSLHRWLSNWVWQNSRAPAALLLSVWTSIGFTGTSISFTTTIRDVILMGALYYALGIWQNRRGVRNKRFRSGFPTSPVVPTGNSPS